MKCGALIVSDFYLIILFLSLFFLPKFKIVLCFFLTSVVAGLGEKVNDSLDMMFDTTAYGEYKSFSGTQLRESQPCQEEEEEDEGSHCAH